MAITEKEVMEYLLQQSEIRLGRPLTDFGTMWRKKYDWNGPLTYKALGKEMWNVYCRDRYHWRKENQTEN